MLSHRDVKKFKKNATFPLPYVSARSRRGLVMSILITLFALSYLFLR